MHKHPGVKVGDGSGSVANCQFMQALNNHRKDISSWPGGNTGRLTASAFATFDLMKNPWYTFAA